jgi:tetratricopeptide (TPR) repeat protein
MLRNAVGFAGCSRRVTTRLVRRVVPRAPIDGHSHGVVQAFAMLKRSLDGLRHLARLVAALTVGSGAALLLTACEVAGPKKAAGTAHERPVTAAPVGGNPAGASDQTRVPPSRILLMGVPFVSFEDAARMRLPHGAFMYSNPSQTACLAMVLENWGYRRNLLERTEAPELDNWQHSGGQGGSLDDIKALLVKGVPVQVVVALTPYGDRFPDTEPIAETVRKVGAAEGPRSGVLGRIVRFEDLPKIAKEWGIDAEQDPMHVAIYGSTRLVMGYDDDHKVLVLHDPTFGPAFEMSYDDFMLTWDVLGRRYVGSYPPDYAKVLAKRGSGKPYRQRTPQEEAAFYYVYGYALNAIGRSREGAEKFRKGLANTRIGRGYQHLFELELAYALAAQGDAQGAIDAAEAATELVPQDPIAWWLLDYLYARSSYSDAALKAAQARSKGDKLAMDEGAAATLSRVLPRDFWVMTLGYWASR